MSIIAILIASLLGSLHCVGMCGGFVALYSVSGGNSWWPHASYNFGRLLTYLSLGIIGGAIGRALDSSLALVGIGRGAGLVLGSAMIIWGISSFVKIRGIDKIKRSIHDSFTTVYRRLSILLGTESPSSKAFLIGLLSTLLPCGWLYGYAAIAAASASPISGALVMFVFWLGTLPLMLGLGKVLSPLLIRFQRVVPVLTSILVMLGGIFTLLGHFGLPSLIGHHSHH